MFLPVQGRRRAACPRPICCPGAKGPPRRALALRLDYTVSHCFKLRDWRTPPAYVVPGVFTLFFFYLSHGSWERDAGRLPSSGLGSGLLSLSPSGYLTLKSESAGELPGPGSCQGRRQQLGTRQRKQVRARAILASLTLTT